MPILAVTNVVFSIGQDIILDGATLAVEPDDRIGLVGRNGTGKTTLLRLIADNINPDSGEINTRKGAKIGYLRQDPDVDQGRTLRTEAASAFDELRALHDELEDVYHQMADASDERVQSLLRRQENLEHRIEAAGGYAVDHRIDEILHGLGFTDDQFDIPIPGLSGGQLGRLALAKLLLKSPDLLLLDEPTNHLDIPGCEWLENFLLDEFRGAVLMVSHDRYMLDRVVTRIEEVEDGRLIDYPGNYSAFRSQRADRKLTQARAYEKQQARFKKEEEFIRRFKAGQRAKQARGRESRLERAKDETTLERPLESESFALELPKAPRSGELVIVMRGGSAWYDNNDDGTRNTLFENLDVTISRGERWGIIGPNGAGKSTLIRCMLGEQPLSDGAAKLGSNVSVGHFSQLEADVPSELAVYRYLQELIKKENEGQLLSEQQARDLAGAFLFSGAVQERPLNELSGGERARARLAGLLASAKNLLVLDEPTNHLDIPSAERLEQALRPSQNRKAGFDGTLLLISHDRALIDATCEHLIVLDGKGNAQIFHGNYSEWHERELRRAAPTEQPRHRNNAPGQPTPAATPQPQHDANNAAARKSPYSWMPTERLEAEIQQRETRLKQIDGDLAREEVYSDAERCRALLAERDQTQDDLSGYEEEWLGRLEG